MTKRILLVENEKNLARFIDLELQKAGYVVDLVEQGEIALKLLQATEYDLILLNYELEDMSGEDFAQRLSKIRPAAVLIVLDSREKISEHMESIQRFAVSYVIKPFVISDLVEKIIAIFRGRDFIDQHCNQMKVPTSYRNLRIDFENHMVYRGEEVIDLTRREYDLLATLMGSKHVLGDLFFHEDSEYRSPRTKELYQNCPRCRLPNARITTFPLMRNLKGIFCLSKRKRKEEEIF